jgi:hypothetical protein
VSTISPSRISVPMETISAFNCRPLQSILGVRGNSNR